MTRRAMLGGAAVALLANTVRPGWAQTSPILVYKDPNCGCCQSWVRHLEKAGFTVRARETTDLATVRAGLGVPIDLASCHSAEIDGYVLEGHVPAVAVQRLLAQRPDAIGLAVPGMPAGSPGMGGMPAEKYAVILFGATDRKPFMTFIGPDQTG
ncbi:protein of unknown function DUF411 [Rhodopseudomonas palustris TIE-1]|nr:protein of unknown function DUF411 [Rhodopseudomonas palustris TIE-1]